MEITNDRPVDPTQRRRQLEAARGQQASVSSAASRPDATYTGGDSASISRLVEVLRTMNPSDVQRIDRLKERIADGSYRADPEELADLLLGRAQTPPQG